MIRLTATAAMAVAWLCMACAPVAPAVSEPQVPLVGADRDAHGCIGSAGYRWCARTQRCERPWELAHERGVVPSEEAFNKDCDNR